MSEENLLKLFNPKDIDLSIYRGYLLWEAQQDIAYVVEAFKEVAEIKKVELISQYFLKVYAPVDYVIATFGEDYFDPEDGEYPGYFSHIQLKTAAFLPFIIKAIISMQT